MTSDLETIAERLEAQAVLAEALNVDGRPHGVEPHEIKVAVAELRAWIAANKESEASLRMILWLEHGHQGLYGDDGEMQCNTCVVDYKHQPMARLIDAWNASRRERQVSEARAARPQRKAFVEAAIREHEMYGRLNDFENLTSQTETQRFYRDMIEAEKVEAERGEAK